MGLEEIVKKEYVENDDTLCFKTTSVAKVIVLSILTGGIYDIIWAFNIWRTLRDNFGYKVSPFWRGLFLALTNFKMFSIIDKYAQNFNIRLPYANLLAVLYLVFCLISNKLEFKSLMLDKTDWTLEIASWILVILSTLIVAFVQHKINKVNETAYPDAPKNTWKVSNTVWLIIFIVLYVLAYLPA